MAQRFSKSFYNSKEWKEIRESILMRDKYLCRLCGEPAEEVHHIIRVSPENIEKKETHTEDNLISLCRNCHCRLHDKDRGKKNHCGDEFYFDDSGQICKISPRG